MLKRGVALRRRQPWRLEIGMALLGLACCTPDAPAGQSAEREKSVAPARKAAASEAAEKASGENGKISFKSVKDDRVELLCKLKPKGDDYKVYDGQDAVLGKVKITSDRVKLKGPEGAEQWKVKRKQDGAEVEDGAGKRLYRVKASEAGGWKLEDGDGNKLFKFKKKDDGFEVRRADGTTVAKVKERTGKLVFRTEDGQDLFELKGMTRAEAGMWWALDSFSCAERAALGLFFLKVYRP
jgi:hypothetical protein